MHVPFRPARLEQLARWIFRDLDAGGPVLGVPRENFEVPDPRLGQRLFGRPLAAPLGVAAGPHTQLAQNIVAAWLCGARFIELKTVQVLDRIEVPRPCIDSADDTYNCEWSQELTLDQSFDEYLKAWVLLHALAHRMGLDGPGAVFSMSVGYDLAGIQSDAVMRFLSRMRATGRELLSAVEAVARAYPAVRDVTVSDEIANQITLSTMHGCPPEEIERIARFLLVDLRFHTWVKLNPTLLGPSRLRGLLNASLGHEIEVPEAAFEHDPKLGDAVPMLLRLEEAARRLKSGIGRRQTARMRTEGGALVEAPYTPASATTEAPTFGVKLSNTLEVENWRTVFGGDATMYLSGRALHPLTLSLAQLVSEATGGRVPVSFCGGADAAGFPELVADGLAPVTVCTDLLKPGGYARLQQYLVGLESAMTVAGAETLDEWVRSRGPSARENLARHARRAAADPRFARRERRILAKGPRPLGRFDCIAAPCQEACPAHQNVPDYLFHVAQGAPEKALEVILRTNALPAITGSACDHPCTDRCVQNHYDAPIAIREIKRFAVLYGAAGGEVHRGPSRRAMVAIVGAGPAGLSAAYFLARAGLEPVVFEARPAPGGMVQRTIPAYRLDRSALVADIDRIRSLGVEIRFGHALGRSGLTLQSLLDQGFAEVFCAIGAPSGKKLGIPGEGADGVLDALVLLEQVASGRPPAIGRRVVVVGGGNSAMDAARTARRLVPGGSVILVYRRTRAQMPASPEEIRACLDEGVQLRDLVAPVRVEVRDGRVEGLLCQRTKLGEPDLSGRARPVPIDGSETTVFCDTLVSAIGQEPLLDFPTEGIALNPDRTIKVDARTMETTAPGIFAGGDVVRGPSSIIQAVADGRAAAEEIGRRHGVAIEPEPLLKKPASVDALMARRARRTSPRSVPVLPPERRKGFDEVVGSFGPDDASIEASRCLDCDKLCSLCVTVCPNRANVAFVVEPFERRLPDLTFRAGALEAAGASPFAVRQAVQVANIADFCNECGNCTTFCPTAGAPWRDKPRFWIDAAGFDSAEGDAFRLTEADGAVVLDARIGGVPHRVERRGGLLHYRGPRFSARLAADDWALVEATPAGPMAEGERVDWAACATMIALFAAESALPAI